MWRQFRRVAIGGMFLALGCEQKPGEMAAKPASLPAKKVTSEDVHRDLGKAAQTTAEYSLQAKEEFQKDLQERLKVLDAEIVKLREKGRGLADDAKINWDKKMAELKTKRDAASAKLAEVGRSTAEAWKDVRKGAHAAWEELEKSFQEAAREF